MTQTELANRVGLIAATRLRRSLHWRQTRGETLPDATIQQMIRSQVYRLWGYDDLRVCLLVECGLSAENAARHMVWAIKEGHEDGTKYGNRAAARRGAG